MNLIGTLFGNVFL